MTVSISGTDGVTFNDSSVQDTAATGFGFKNRIINGSMVLDQRNAGASVAITQALGTYTLDRYRIFEETSGSITVQQSSTAPAGFINSLLVTVTSADATLGATEQTVIQQPIEGLNVADFGWGTANAATVTLSFWVRSSVTGTFGGSFSNDGVSRSYPFTYTINAANTFEQKTITVAGDTSGTWLTTNGVGIRLYFSLGAGTTYSGTANAWAAAQYVSATGATNLIGTNGATFYITGVQLEKGSTATSFDYRPFGTELALCQRYFQTLTQASNEIMGFFVDFSTTALVASYVLGVQMRTTPTYIATVTSYRQNGRLVDANSTNTPVLTKASLNNGRLDLSGFTGLTAGDSGVLVTNSSGFTALTAEL